MLFDLSKSVNGERKNYPYYNTYTFFLPITSLSNDEHLKLIAVLVCALHLFRIKMPDRKIPMQRNLDFPSFR